MLESGYRLKDKPSLLLTSFFEKRVFNYLAVCNTHFKEYNKLETKLLIKEVRRILNSYSAVIKVAGSKST